MEELLMLFKDEQSSSGPAPAPQLKPCQKPIQCAASNAIVNNCAIQPPPGPPSAEALPRSAAGGRVLGSTQPAPLLVLARFGQGDSCFANYRNPPVLLAPRQLYLEALPSEEAAWIR